MRVASWNVNSLRARLEHTARFLAEIQPDVLCLQETKCTDDEFPHAELAEAGYPHRACHGQQTYNGVAILSKHPLEDVQRGFLDGGDDEKRVIAATVAGVRVYGLYAINGMKVGSPRFHDKLRWFDRLREELGRFTPGDDVLVCGDLNIAPDDLDVWDPFLCDGRLLCHPDERSKLRELMDWGLVDAFREKHPFANDFSWWDYRQMGFQRNHGLRIDHVLLTRPLMERCREATIHREVRAWDTPSDHAPVSVDLA